MSQADRQPTGVERAFDPREIFFSTTDKRGVIDMVNSTFVNLSAFTSEELLSQPHNIVRHPQMPGGVFHLLWEHLHGNRSFGAYITNLAKDGAHYRTLALVSALGEGFVSVRIAVSREDLWEPIHELYARVRAFELNLQDEGLGKAAAAERGAEELVTQLRELGYESYADVMRAVIPAEVRERRRLAPPKLPLSARGEKLFGVVHALMEVDSELVALATHHQAATELASRLGGAGEAIAATLTDLHAAADLAASVSENAGAKVLATSSQAALDLVSQVEVALQPLGGTLAKERHSLLDLHVALAQTTLHADMAVGFAGEVASGATVGNPVYGVELLGRAMGASVRELGELQEQACAGLMEVAAEISRAQVILADFQRALTNWRTMVLKFGASAAIGEALSVVDARLAAGLRDMAAMTDLAEQCRHLGQPVNLTPLARAANDLVEAAQSL